MPRVPVLLAALAALGIDAELPEEVRPRDLRKITERLGKSPDRPFIESLVVRSMPQAVYQPTNIGHFGLALEGYAHFTSPIRRYPDLVVHRALKAVCDAHDPTGARRSADELAVLGQELSKLEKRADDGTFAEFHREAVDPASRFVDRSPIPQRGTAWAMSVPTIRATGRRR